MYGDENMKKITLKVGGMSCSACSNGLEKFLNKQEGIIEANVNLVMNNATIEYDENILNIAYALEKSLGYANQTAKEVL